jgi:hypothetical protein
LALQLVQVVVVLAGVVVLATDAQAQFALVPVAPVVTGILKSTAKKRGKTLGCFI